MQQPRRDNLSPLVHLGVGHGGIETGQRRQDGDEEVELEVEIGR